MSMFDDAGLANVLSPLRHNLVRNQPLPSQFQAGMDNPATRLQTASRMGQSRTPMPQAGPGQKGPMARDVYKSLMLKQMGITKDHPDYNDYDELTRNPNVTPEMMDRLLKTYTPPAPEQHGSGSIEIKQGTGPRAMGEQAIADWMRRAAHQAGQGETVTEIDKNAPVHGMGRAQMLAPQQQITGFKVGNIAPPAQPPQHKSAEQMKQEHEMATLAHQKETEERAGRREEESNKHAAFSENNTVLGRLEQHAKELMERDPGIARGHAKDPNVMKDWQATQQQIADVNQRMQGLVTPQQMPQPPKQGHPLDPQSAQHFLQAAGGDKNKARQLAQQAGWSF